MNECIARKQNYHFHLQTVIGIIPLLKQYVVVTRFATVI